MRLQKRRDTSPRAAEAARRAAVQDAFDLAHQRYGGSPVERVRTGLRDLLERAGVTGLPDVTIESAAAAIARGLRPVPRW